MTETIQQSELRNNNAEIMRRVAAGESFTVTVHGHAVADIVPHRAGHSSRFVSAGDLDDLFAAAGPGPDPAMWRRDMAEADRVFGEDLPGDPWDPAVGR